MSEQEKSVTERLNELVTGLNDRGRERLLDIAKGYEMCHRDNRDEMTRQSVSVVQPRLG